MQSVIHNSFIIDDKTCVVALVRKPEGQNRDHAFILIEGLNNYGQAFLSRFDLVADRDKIDICKIVPKTITVDPKARARTLKEMLAEHNQPKETVGSFWNIKKSEATQLKKNILASVKWYEENPQPYNIVGNKASGPKSATALRSISPTSAEAVSKEIANSARLFGPSVAAVIKGTVSPSGQNCFTWAREMLLSINNLQIEKEMPSSPLELLGSMPSYLMTDDRNKDVNSFQSRLCS